MQRAMYPMPYMKITQGYDTGSHAGTFALDDGGSDGGIDFAIAPFDCIVKRIYTSDANEVWIESLSPVLYADGTQDYMCMMFLHDNDVSNLWVGEQIKQGERFYEEGSKGRGKVGTFANHLHIECGKGKFIGNGWYKNSHGIWTINNGKKIHECLWIDETYKILNNGGLDWKVVPKTIGNPVSRNENQNQVEILIDNLRCRKTPNGDVLGYIKKGYYNYTDAVLADGYWWYKIPEGWVATSTDEGWTRVYPKKEEKVEEDPKMIAELQKQIAELKEENEALKNLLKEKDKNIQEKDTIIKTQNAKITSLEEVIKTKQEEEPNMLFSCFEDGDYSIKLYKDETLVYKIVS